MQDEYSAIEREIHIDAVPEVVFEVITRPEHLREWWPDDASLDPVPGGTGELVWHGGNPGEDTMAPMTVVEAVPYSRFSFRWAYAPDALPDPTNSFLVTFDLTPSGTGTNLRMTETGFREQGWEVAVLEEAYRDHATSWDRFLPQLAKYAAGLVSSR
jgi:uncharacterized protein YndB with AHSA1/START domain